MFVRGESCLKNKSKLLGTEFGSGNGIQDWSKIRPQEVQAASEIGSGGFQRSRVAKRRLLKASGTLEDASRLSFRKPFGRLEPFQTRQGSTAKKELKSECVVEGFWGVSETDFECFLRFLLNRSISERENNVKVRIFKNTSVFTVRLHLGLVDKTRRTLARTLFFSISG